MLSNMQSANNTNLLSSKLAPLLGMLDMAKLGVNSSKYCIRDFFLEDHVEAPLEERGGEWWGTSWNNNEPTKMLVQMKVAKIYNG